MTKRHMLTSDQWTEIARLYESGEGLRSLSVKFGAGTETIRQRLHKAGVAVRAQMHLTESQIDEAVAAYTSGASTVVLAARFNINPETVAKALRARGVVLRPAGCPVGTRTGPRALTEDQLRELGELYRTGFGTVELAAHFGVCENTVHDWLVRSGVDIRAKEVLTEAQVDEVVAAYGRGESTLALGSRFGCNPQTIANTLQRRGAALRDAGGHRRLSLREDAFDVLTPESAYWIGFLAADGCVTGTGDVVDQVKLALKDSDADHVAAFRDFLGSRHALGLSESKHPTRDGERLYGVGLAVRSRRLVEALARYGITPRKTHTLELRGGAESSRDAWRGVIDGDGTIGIYPEKQGDAPCLKLVGASKAFLEQFRAFLAANGVRGEHSVCVDSHSNSLGGRPKYVVRLGARAALDAAALLYADGYPVLPRKRDAARALIRRGIRRELVGTFADGWYDARAAVWAGEPAH